ncbi:MAG: alpha/beta hydrolase [Gemmatimonadaceae bacterium]|nr:alpha/beta hydrolase [Gemmatimonadaceae bacterium]
MPLRQSVRPWLALLFAIPAAFLATWIVIPAPNETLLPLGVGAPEVSAWFIVLGVLSMSVAAVDLRRRWLSRVAFGLAVVAVGLSAIPFVRFREVANAADHALRMALGGEQMDKLAASHGGIWRPNPLVVRDLFRAPQTLAAPIRVSHGLRVAVVADDTLTVDIYRPSAKGPFPVLVQIYGGAWQHGVPGNNAEFAEYIAAQGYVVFAIDYRHAPQFRFPAQVDDVRNALAWIGRNADAWSADTSRMVLIGRSAGAHLAMMAAYATDAPRIRGVIDYYGPVDLVEGYRQPPVPDPLAVRDIEEKFLGGPPSAMIDRYHAASPISLATRRLPPTLLIYGGRDHIVEPRFGALLAGRLRADGTTVVHVEIPWAEHAFDAVPYGPSGQLARYVSERFLAWATAK